jgi:formylglycine-generating enzyme required for sulfatase activity
VACLLLGLLVGQGCATKAILDPASDQPWTVPDLGMELMPVAAGGFMMGLGDGGARDEKPAHEVRISHPYWIGKTEVTHAQWQAVMGSNPMNYKGNDGSPVETVTWHDAVSFCQKLTEHERAADCLPDGYVYRLPTEAEWEYAARGGAKIGVFVYSGSSSLDEVGWYTSNSDDDTHPVGQKQPNELGLYDMSGNVWEWCHDWYGDYPSGSVTDPAGPSSGSERVFRGGSWTYSTDQCRVTKRRSWNPLSAECDIGFRVSLGPPVQGVNSSPGPLPVPEANVPPEDLGAVTANATPPAIGQPWTVPDLGMEFVWIPALTCWVGKYEVTNGEYRKSVPEHDSQDYEEHSLNGDRQPVVFVNFDNAMAYAAWLTKRERDAGRIPAGYRYRLPTADEWIAFAQCGDNREYPWGNSMPPKYGNYCGQETKYGPAFTIDGWIDDSIVTCPVEKSGKNDWGLYGVGGNVWELTVGAPSDLSFAAWRGASWFSSAPDNLRSAYRIVYLASTRTSNFGFRLVLSR